jgi:hypothetical protein
MNDGSNDKNGNKTTKTNTLLAMLAAGLLATGAIFTAPQQRQMAFASTDFEPGDLALVQLQEDNDDDNVTDLSVDDTEEHDDDNIAPECENRFDDDPNTAEIMICTTTIDNDDNDNDNVDIHKHIIGKVEDDVNVKEVQDDVKVKKVEDDVNVKDVEDDVNIKDVQDDVKIKKADDVTIKDVDGNVIVNVDDEKIINAIKGKLNRVENHLDNHLDDQDDDIADIQHDVNVVKKNVKHLSADQQEQFDILNEKLNKVIQQNKQLKLQLADTEHDIKNKVEDSENDVIAQINALWAWLRDLFTAILNQKD